MNKYRLQLNKVITDIDVVKKYIERNGLVISNKGWEAKVGDLSYECNELESDFIVGVEDIWYVICYRCFRKIKN